MVVRLGIQNWGIALRQMAPLTLGMPFGTPHQPQTHLLNYSLCARGIQYSNEKHPNTQMAASSPRSMVRRSEVHTRDHGFHGQPETDNPTT